MVRFFQHLWRYFTHTFADERWGFQLKLFKLVLLIKRQWQQRQRGWSQEEEEEEDQEGCQGRQETIKRGMKLIQSVISHCRTLLYSVVVHLHRVKSLHSFILQLNPFGSCFQSLLNPSYLREARQVEKEIKKEPVTERRDRWRNRIYHHNTIVSTFCAQIWQR